jgi:hypothetical protein
MIAWAPVQPSVSVILYRLRPSDNALRWRLRRLPAAVPRGRIFVVAGRRIYRLRTERGVPRHIAKAESALQPIASQKAAM